ncbi:reticulon-like protein B9 [Apium graveolens]|uniref:Reticulon-like protein n=1 Tax=Apium graveolens TaxID=4045 RepID=A0A6L5B742_APIGR|nr:hypothetical protein AG4045_016318 [Apium graveolens]
MPVSSSDSEEQATPSVHSLLGGGPVADVLLWRERKMSYTIIAAVTITWFLFEVVEYNLSTLLFHIFITTMLIIFNMVVVANIWFLEQRDAQSRNIVSRNTVSLRTILAYLAWYEFFRLFAMAVLSLWLLSLIGNYIGAINLLFYGTLSLGTLPFLYERYKKEVDHILDRKMGKIYKRLFLKK